MSLLRLFAGPVLCLFAFSAHAGDVLFYVSENGEPANTEFAFSINGEQKAINKSGIAFFNLPAGSYDVQYFEFGEEAGETSFTLAEGNNAEIIIDLVDGVPETEVSVYTPGAEESPPVGLILGEVSTLEDSAPQGLEGANVSVSGSNVLIVTDEFGGYAVQLARGVYDITVDHPEHGSRTVSDVYVISGVTSQLNLTFSPESEDDPLLEEVVTVGQYQPNDIAQTERFSVTVIDALSAEQIARFGDSNAAATLKRVSGVTTDRGQFAIVRGLSGRYVSSTLNGVVTPSTDPTRRDAPLDLFPSGVLKSVSVQKGFSPDAPGDSTGGYIQIETRGLPDERIHKVGTSLGYNTEATFQDVETYDGGSSDIFGFDSGNRDIPSLVSQVTQNGRVNPVPTDNPGVPGATDPDTIAADGDSLSDIYLVEEETGRPDFSLSYTNGNLYELNKISWGYYADISLSNSTERQVDGISNTLTINANDELVTSEGGSFGRSRFETDLSAYFVTGLEFEDGSEVLSKTLFSRVTQDQVRNSFGLETGVNLFRNNIVLQYVERQLITQQFSGTHFFATDDKYKLDWRASISRTNRDEPDRRIYSLESEEDALVPELQLSTSSVQRQFGELVEDAVDLGLDFEWSEDWNDSIFSTFKTGISYLNRFRESGIVRIGFRDPGGIPSNINPEIVLNDDNIGLNSNNEFEIFNVSQASDFYEAEWDISALYFSSETEFGAGLTLLAGARYENSEQVLITAPLGGGFNSFERNVLEEDAFLPALALTWAANDTQQIKFGYSKTVSRPDFTELSNALYIDPIFDFQVRGNPDLEISDIDNIDLRFENYFNDEDSLSIAFFYKYIQDPIELILLQASGSAAGTRSFDNEETAEVFGVEFDLQTTLFEDDLSRLFFQGNLALIESEVQLSSETAAQEGQTSRRLQGQSDFVLNLIFGWDDYKRDQSLTVLLNLSGDRISEVGQGDLPDILQEGVPLLSLTYKYDVNDKLTFKAKADNLLDSEIRRTQGGQLQSEFSTGAVFQIGFEYAL